MSPYHVDAPQRRNLGAKPPQPCPFFPWAYWAANEKCLAVITEQYYYLTAGVRPAGEVQSSVSAPSLNLPPLSAGPGWIVSVLGHYYAVVWVFLHLPSLPALDVCSNLADFH